MAFKLVFNYSKEGKIEDRPEEFLDIQTGPFRIHLIEEISSLVINPFNIKGKNLEGPPWKGFISWHPSKRNSSSIENYRVIYSIGKSKVFIHRIGHRSVIYRKL